MLKQVSQLLIAFKNTISQGKQLATISSYKLILWLFEFLIENKINYQTAEPKIYTNTQNFKRESTNSIREIIGIRQFYTFLYEKYHANPFSNAIPQRDESHQPFSIRKKSTTY